MTRARQLGALLLLAHVAFAQTSTNIPAAPVVTNLSVSGQNTEVRIEVSATAVVTSAKVTAAYGDRIALDLPGVVYNMLPRRTVVNKNGVKAVRIWQQSENPPLTRMLIELDKGMPYLLSSEGNTVVLRIGPRLREQVQRASKEPRPAERQNGPVAPGRTSPAVSAAQAVVGVFRRGGKSSPTSQSENVPPPTQAAAEPLPPFVFVPPNSEPTAPADSSKSNNLSVRAENPAAKVTEEPKVARPAAPLVTAPPASDVAVNKLPPAPTVDLSKANNPTVVAESPAPKVAEEPKAAQPAAPLVVAPPALDLTANSRAENPAPKVTEEPKAAQPAAPLVAAAPASDVVVNKLPPAAPAVDSSKTNNPSVVAESPVPKVTEEPKAEPPAVPAPPAPNLTANNFPAAPPSNEPVTVAPTAVPSAAVEPPKPVREISEADIRALTESVNTGMRTAFQVKHIQDETVYLDGGRSSGLAEGMTLTVKGGEIVKNKDGDTDKDAKDTKTDVGSGDNAPGTIAELQVIGVAETSAVAEIHSQTRELTAGDLAFLSPQDTEALVEQHTMGTTRKYPAVITFTESDLLDNEARAFVPRAPLPSVNRLRGRIGVDYMATMNRDTSQSRSSDLGIVFRADFTRIGGTYWNLGGYWRGRINSFSGPAQPTLQDLLNRTYHMALTYQNPGSKWVAGIGRMYLPWASSLNTIDGGYFGRRIKKTVTVGVFAGSSPDPTSWNYNPDLRLGGTFVNFEGGDFEKTHYMSTSGIGVELLKWKMQRPFVFFENSINYKRFFSIYHSLQADRPAGNPAVPSPGAGISQSFLTARVAPISRIEFSVNHTYFRDIPTYDPTLVGTGLLDKYLFQGVSAGVRVEVVKPISLYTTMGESNRSGDAKRSLNQLYGITFAKVPWLGLTADVHYSKFNSSFGGGTYRAVSITRNFGDGFHINVLGGDQSITSALAGNQGARFLTTSVDTSLGAKFFLQGGLTFYRGQLQNYNQWFTTFGYRFDTKGKQR